MGDGENSLKTRKAASTAARDDFESAGSEFQRGKATFKGERFIISDRRRGRRMPKERRDMEQEFVGRIVI